MLNELTLFYIDPDSKFHGANMGPTWVLSAPDGPHVGPMNLAIRGYISNEFLTDSSRNERTLLTHHDHLIE